MAQEVEHQTLVLDVVSSNPVENRRLLVFSTFMVSCISDPTNEECLNFPFRALAEQIDC